jgi:Spy/CpxP family protein refolding chaperone
MSKKRMTLAAVILLTGALVIPLWAFGANGKGNNNRANSRITEQRKNILKDNLTEEQIETLKTLHEEFYDETLSLRNDLRTKKTELINIMSEKEPDEKEAKSVQKEISEIQAELGQKQIEQRIRIREIIPDIRYGRGISNRQMMGRSIGMGSNDPSAAETGSI